MLDLMRKNAGSWMVKFILGAIIVVFCFWGIGSYQATRGNRVASVDDEIISMEEYTSAYDALVEELRRSVGERLDAEMLKTLQVKQQALNGLIDQRLLLREAQRLGIRVSDEELARSIRGIKAFQRGGEFDQPAYTRLLTLNRTSPEAFEADQRRQMAIERLRQTVLEGVRIEELELQQWYAWRNASVRIGTMFFTPDGAAIAASGSGGAQAYFEQHREQYKTPPMARVRYLFFDPRILRAQVTVSDSELQDYYDNNSGEYRIPATVEARHILLKLDSGAPATLIEQQRLKAEEIHRQALAGQDFAALARQHSEGPDREGGGYLGTFPREAMVKPFADAAFMLPEGGISPPVLTSFGWHIIKVEKINAASIRPLSEVTAEIRGKIEERRARDLAYETATAAYDATLAGTAFDKAAAERQLLLLEAGPFGAEGPAKGVAEPRPFAAAALAMAEGEISDVKEFKDGFYLVQTVERVAERLPAFDEVQGRVQADWQRQLREDQARHAAEAVIAGLKGGETPEAAATKVGRSWTASDYFRRDEAIPGLGREEEISAEAFKLTSQAPLCEKAIKGKGGYYVVRLLERRAPDPAALEAQRAEIERLLLQQKQFKTFADLLADLRKGSRIRIEERLFE